MLFKDRSLNIALLISASWHLVCIFSINPVLLPEHMTQRQVVISFLGSILEKVDQVSLLYNTDKLNTLDSVSPLIKENEDMSGFIMVESPKEQLSFPSPVYNPVSFGIAHKKEAPEIKMSNFLIKGEAKDRPVLYRPDLPKIFILPSDFNTDYIAYIRFKVSRYGFIKQAECITSSGSSEADQLALRYIRKWQFAPSLQDNQEGMIRVSLQ